MRMSACDVAFSSGDRCASTSIFLSFAMNLMMVLLSVTSSPLYIRYGIWLVALENVVVSTIFSQRILDVYHCILQRLSQCQEIHWPHVRFRSSEATIQLWLRTAKGLERKVPDFEERYVIEACCWTFLKILTTLTLLQWPAALTCSTKKRRFLIYFVHTLSCITYLL